jgi:ABC-type amino acid transport substrate-binding protein
MHTLKVMWAVAIVLSMVLAREAQADTLAKIRDSGAIVIGHRAASPPFSYVDQGGRPVGYSIDLCKRIAAAVKDELGLKDIKIDYVPVTAKNRFSMLQQGKVDIVCGSTTNTLKRRERVAFTLLTFVMGSEMLVRTGSGISGLKDLEGKKVGVLAGTTTHTGLTKALKRQFINAQVVIVKDHGDGVNALEDGKVDAYTSDQLILIGLARKARDPSKLMLTNQVYSFEPYALVVRRDDPDFLLIADRTLASLYRSGRIKEIYSKWIGAIGLRPTLLLKALYVLQGIPRE